jgi:hypothetical protein
MFQRSHHVSVALRPRCSFLRITLFDVCRIYTGVISKETQIDTIYKYTLQCGAALFLYALAWKFHL